jgi:truncated hemoglobin YjbI
LNVVEYKGATRWIKQFAAAVDGATTTDTSARSLFHGQAARATGRLQSSLNHGALAMMTQRQHH